MEGLNLFNGANLTLIVTFNLNLQNENKTPLILGSQYSSIGKSVHLGHIITCRYLNDTVHDISVVIGFESSYDVGPSNMHKIYTCILLYGANTHVSKSIFTLRSHANSVHISILKGTNRCCTADMYRLLMAAAILFVNWSCTWFVS